jgi:hypothetical protein
LTWPALLAGGAAFFGLQPARAQDTAGGVAPSEGSPSDAAPSDAAPSDAAPSDAAPGDAAPTDTQVAQAQLAQTAVAPSETEVGPSDSEVVVQGESQVAPSESESPRGPFSKGSVRITGLIGTGSAVNDQYLIVGIGAGYFILKGLDLGADYEAWLFGDPTFQRLSPGLRYILDLKAAKPYVGVFYRHTFVSDYEDFDQVGARAGLYIVPKGPMFIGAGAVYERLLNCDDTSVVDCDEVYPELTFGVSL